ncbi:MAG: aldo/keto reductase [Clostridia bacterium]|nr:aldo/keto reductase [Clostridia bacterium]
MLMKKFPGLDLPVSALGFGAMRLPTTADGKIDRPEAIRMIRHAIDNGVNYVDTAYPYHDGESELVVAEALKDGYREKVILATKLPVWKVEKHEDMMALLDEQLAKLQVECIDFYLLHALGAERFELLRRVDYKKFLDEAIAQGKIKYPAFSFHDNADTFLEILNDYDWKMCQIQMNVLDGDTQATLAGIRTAGEKGVGVVVMEPLRGGLLANPPADVQALYDAFPVRRSAVEWSFRYLYTMPEVTTILSGMSTFAQVEDNLRIFGAADGNALAAEEAELLAQVKETYLSRVKTRCTGCRYCQPCPMGVQIPRIFQNYDGRLLRGDKNVSEFYAKITADNADFSHCVGCRQCEDACPQHLPITQYLEEIHADCTK